MTRSWMKQIVASMSAFALASMGVGSLARCEEVAAAPNVDSTWVTSIAKFGNEGKFAASTATGLLLRPADVVSFDASDPSKLTKLYTHPAAVWRLVVTDDGSTIASVDYRGNLMTMNRGESDAKLHEKAFERWCQALTITPDQKSLVAGNEAGKVFAWDLAEGKVRKSVELDGHAVTGLSVSPDGKQVAACDGGGHVHLLSWPELESVGKIEINAEPAWCIAFVNDGKQLLLGSGDRHLYRVDATDGAKAESVAEGSDWITQIAVSPGGQVVASEVGGKLHFPGASSDPMTAPSGVWSLAWNGDGQLLVGTRKSGVVTAGRSWNWTAPQPADSQPANAEPTAKTHD
ncbi:WD domain, G-beta repeat [Rubripirellula tenax]|uniref:WD domain, G-beta repeat n=1 Tax=Rubripirellula tenax TaxID=2528015 RepID=A0A5C6FGG6_9BACT|nr:hypothetical protein [Rubripirellula tenax]TWU59186.1 WD domain, G-beta repeat [Rubripirellula tenax]